jgi:hypothetical protein
MISNAVPPLALALGAATASRLRLEDREIELRAAFLPAIAAMDEADKEYRSTIGDTLPAESAGVILGTMAEFRRQVRAIREQARGEINELYRRYGRTYDTFDPLDPYSEPPRGFSHADGTRAATIADAARARVNAFRGQVNDAVLKQLQPAQIDTLIVAKRRRHEAFETALKGALEGHVIASASLSSAELEKALYQLTQLADGWY